jgi:phosphoenolpyruvate carboxykinase (ATP)
MKIAYTRAMITAALTGQLDTIQYRRHSVFNIDVPASCPNVPDAVLDPRTTWPDVTEYDAQARKLAGMFIENFKSFEKDVAPAVREAGPTV